MDVIFTLGLPSRRVSFRSAAFDWAVSAMDCPTAILSPLRVLGGEFVDPPRDNQTLRFHQGPASSATASAVQVQRPSRSANDGIIRNDIIRIYWRRRVRAF